MSKNIEELSLRIVHRVFVLLKYTFDTVYQVCIRDRRWYILYKQTQSILYQGLCILYQGFGIRDEVASIRDYQTRNQREKWFDSHMLQTAIKLFLSAHLLMVSQDIMEACFAKLKTVSGNYFE